MKIKQAIHGLVDLPRIYCVDSMQENIYSIHGKEIYQINTISKEIKLVCTLRKRARHLSLSPNDQYLATGYKTISIIDTTTFKKVQSIKGHRQEILCSKFSADSQQLLTGSGENWSPHDFSVRCWNLATSKNLIKFKSKFAPIIDLSFDANNNILILDQDQIFYELNSTGDLIHSQRPKCFIEPTKGNIVVNEFSGKIIPSKKLSVSNIGRKTLVWEIQTGAILKEFNGRVYALKSAPDEKTVFCRKRDEAPYLLDLNTLSEQKLPLVEQNINPYSIIPLTKEEAISFVD